MSYFEWVQNRLGYKWELDRVQRRSERFLGTAFDKVFNTMLAYGVTMRIAAYIVAIDKVAQTMEFRGGY